MKELLEEMRIWAERYMKSFYTDDEDIQQNILLKEFHTGQVVRHCRALGENLQFTEHDCILAEMIGLFHDIGRFRQYTVYRTFNDRVSENHASMGLAIIESELPLLARLPEADKRTFTFAIANHNALKISAAGSERNLLFAKLIRDADKLDIYRVLQPMLEPSNGSGYSEILQRCFLAGKQCDFADIKTEDDRKVVRLLWLYDIHFAYTMRRIMEAGYADEIVRHLPDCDVTRRGTAVLKAYMQQKASEVI